MVLNYIWVFFFVAAFATAMLKLLILGDTGVFPALVASSFDTAKLGFEISLGLTGVLALWLGLMKIGEKAGMVQILARAIGPLFSKIFPDLKENHPAYGPMVMNLAANMLNLDNAATPLGLKAMEELQKSNPVKDTASNPQIMFLVLNTSGLTLIPVSIMVYRAQLGAADPSDIFIPILVATYFSTMAGLISVAVMQKINLLQKTVLSYLGGLTAVIAALLFLILRLPPDVMQVASSVASNIILFTLIIAFILMGVKAKINVYETFVEGAKDGFTVAIKIIPYLIAILVGIGVFRASGAMDIIIDGIGAGLAAAGLPNDFVPALPTALMKPLSGSGARGMMVDAINQYGADSIVGRMVSVVQGATDTTFYIVAVYFGSVGISKTRHAIGCGLLADFVGIAASIYIAYLFFAI
jgi:spore maturation protein SpmA